MRLSVLIFSTCLLACGSAVDRGAPLGDLSTPDKAIQSLWQREIWYSRHQSFDEAKFAHLSTEARSKLKKAFDDGQAKLQIHHPNEKAIIEKVQIESESRAVVFSMEPFYSEDLEHAKYELTKERGHWLINQRYLRCSQCNGEGKIQDLSSLDAFRTKATRPCPSCGGIGWRSILF